MTWVLGLLAVAASLYLVVLLALFTFQRRLMYFPSVQQTVMPVSELPLARVLRLQTTDGEHLVAWYQPAVGDNALYLYFHGNGGSLIGRADLFGALASDGSGFLAIDYRGYGGSTGSPSERGLILDGEAAYNEALKLGYGPARLVVIGESLGSGVAVALAAEHPVRALVLDSAFTSTADVAASEYPIFPVRLLMTDTFDSLARIGRVRAPKLFLHGSADPIIPVALGRRLFEAAPQPKAFIELPGRGHVVLGAPHVIGRMRAWLAGLPPRTATDDQSSFSTR